MLHSCINRIAKNLAIVFFVFSSSFHSVTALNIPFFKSKDVESRVEDGSYSFVEKDQLTKFIKQSKIFSALYFLIISSGLDLLKKDVMVEVFAQISLHEQSFQSPLLEADAKLLKKINSDLSPSFELFQKVLETTTLGSEQYRSVSKELLSVVVDAVRANLAKRPECSKRLFHFLNAFISLSKQINQKPSVGRLPSIVNFAKSGFYFSLMVLTIFIAREVKGSRQAVLDGLPNIGQRFGFDAAQTLAPQIPRVGQDAAQALVPAVDRASNALQTGLTTAGRDAARAVVGVGHRAINVVQSPELRQLVEAAGIAARDVGAGAANAARQDAAADARRADGLRGGIARLFLGGAAAPVNRAPAVDEASESDSGPDAPYT